MRDLFASGRVIDLILFLVVLEFGAFALHRALTGRGLTIAAIAAALAPGAALMLALRAALTSSDWQVIAAWLCAALMLHLLDLWRRVR